MKKRLIGVRLEDAVVRKLKASLALKGLTLTQWIAAQAQQFINR